MGFLLVYRNHGRCHFPSFAQQNNFAAIASRTVRNVVAGALGAAIPIGVAAYSVGVPLRERALLILGAGVLAQHGLKNPKEIFAQGLAVGTVGALIADGKALSEKIEVGYHRIAERTQTAATSVLNATVTAAQNTKTKICNSFDSLSKWFSSSKPTIEARREAEAAKKQPVAQKAPVGAAVKTVTSHGPVVHDTSVTVTSHGPVKIQVAEGAQVVHEEATPVKAGALSWMF